MFKAYVLREELDRLWTYTTREGVAEYLFGWLKALRWQRLPPVAGDAAIALATTTMTLNPAGMDLG